MKRILLLLLILITAISLTACIGGDKPDGSDTDTDSTNEGKLKVLLTIDDKITVTSENPVYVDEGDNAEFEVTVADQFTIDTLSHGEYRDGKIKIKNITEDTVVKAASVFVG